MFVLLSKIIPLLVYPTGLALLLLVLALRSERRRVRRRLLLAAVLLLWLFGNGYVSGLLVRSLEWRYLPESTYPQAGAIVILGGGTDPADYPRPTVEVNGAGDRVLYGARLYQQGLAPVIVASGGNLPWTDTASSPAEGMAAILTAIGVPREAILLEDRSLNTFENAVRTRELLEPLGVDHILLVTSALHMPRALRLFENQGFSVTPAPTDYNAALPSGDKPFSKTWPGYLIGLFPDAFSLARSTAALKEYLGIAVYWLRGWY